MALGTHKVHPLPVKARIYRWVHRYRLLWIRAGIVAFVLLASTTAVSQRPKLVLAGLIALGGAGLIWRVPTLGIVLLIPASQVVPFELGTGTQTTLHAGILLLVGLVGLWALRMLVYERRIAVVASPAVTPILLFSLVVVLAFLAGQLPWYPLTSGAPLMPQIGGTAVFLLSFAAFLLTAQWITRIHHLQWTVGLFLALGGLYILGRFIPPLGRLNDSLFQPRFSGSMFWVWLVAMAGGHALYNRALPMPVRALLAGLTLATLGVAYFQQGYWKSGWVPPLATLAILIGIYSWRFLIFLVPFLVSPVRDLIDSLIASDYYSFSTRVDAWIILLKIVRVNPILGLGPANYYYYTPLYPIRGYYVSFNSHSQYVDLLLQTGILGLLCFLWFAVAVGKLAFRTMRRAQEGFAQGYAHAVLAGLGGTLVAGFLGDWVIPFVYNVTLAGTRASFLPWIFFGGLVALTVMERNGRAPQDSEVL